MPGLSASVVVVELELAAPVGDEPFGAEAHEQDEGEAEGEELVVLEEVELLRDQVEQGGAEERAADGAHAAEDDGGEQEGGVRRDGAGEEVGSGTTLLVTWALTVPARPAREAPRAKARA